MTDLKEDLLAKVNQYQIRLDKNFKDQHLLVCRDVIDQLISASSLSADDSVLEIGPGLGQLTEAILKTGARLISIEIDRGFEAVLQELKCRYPGKFDIIWGSALDVSWPEHVNKVIMNPPFSILEPLLQILYQCRNLELVGMVIGRRYYESAIAKPGNKGFSKSSLLTQAKFEPHLIMDIDKDCFYPRASERSVAMLLVVKNNAHSIIRRLADYLVSNPELHVSFVVQQVLEVINKRARKYKDYEKIVTVKQLNINPSLCNKRLHELTNYEIEQLISKLTSQFNYQRKVGDSKRFRSFTAT